ncbi:sensor histidine kinase [Paramagnetospirillum kuznetsovii]|nr:ATP-binding protein [Paramagnetospirillum kuznetsovii]
MSQTDRGGVRQDEPNEAAEMDGGGSRASPLVHGIGLRLLAAIFMFSTAVTLATTVFELYVDYRGQIQEIRDRFGDVENANLGSLGGAMWSLDTDQLQLQIEGIKRLPDMQYLEVREVGRSLKRRVMVSVGERGVGPVLTQEFPIVYADSKDRSTEQTIGVLYMEATLTGVYNRLVDKAVVILISQGVKTFLVSMFILYIVYRLVTRHLIAIAGYVGRFNLNVTQPLALTRHRPSKEDELDRMVGAFNSMSSGLREAYHQLRDVNAELEEDIAARRKAEEEVTRLNAELEQRVRQRTAELEASNKELDAFTYSVSHDLRAPLRRIEGFGQILDTEYSGSLDERFGHYLTRIRAGARDMAEMIDSFLQLSRSTRSELTVEPINLSDIAHKVASRLREKDPQRSVSIEIAPDLMTKGDRRLMDAVLENLLGNAWKYSRHNKSATISFGTEMAEGRLVYVVRDNGAGFDMNYLDRLFMPFSRLHRAEEFEGTGIGLATVLRILARHGGRIWAEGAIGKGAVFRFTLWEGGVADGKS